MVEESKGTGTYTLVISQYEKSNTIHYTLRIYSTTEFSLNKISEPYIAKYEKQVKTVVTARIRRMREGNIFSLPTLAGGGGAHSQVRTGGGGNTPSQVWTERVPLPSRSDPRSEGGTPGLDRGIPHPGLVGVPPIQD